MKSICLSNNKLGIYDVEIEENKQKGIYIQVIASGICGTDLHILEKEEKNNSLKILGHEFYGKVTKIIDGTRINCLNGEVEVGDYVTVIPGIACGKCEYCMNIPENENYCTRRTVFGLNMHGSKKVTIGGNIERMHVPEEFKLYKINHNWPLGMGTLLEPVSVSLKAVKKGLSNAKSVRNRKMSAIVFGMGTIGFFIAMELQRQGIDVIAIDCNDNRLKRAMNNGIKYTFNANTFNLQIFEDFCKKEMKGIKTDIAFEATGKAETFIDAIYCLRKGGVMVEVGNFVDAGIVDISPSYICNNEIIIMGSVLADATLYKEAEELLNSFVNKSEKIITNYNYSEYNDAYEQAIIRDNCLKNNICF